MYILYVHKVLWVLIILFTFQLVGLFREHVRLTWRRGSRKTTITPSERKYLAISEHFAGLRKRVYALSRYKICDRQFVDNNSSYTKAKRPMKKINTYATKSATITTQY